MLPADPAGALRFVALRTQLAQLAPAQAAPILREMANSVRRDDLHMVYRARLGHLGGDFSVADILVTLYAAVLNVDPVHPLLAVNPAQSILLEEARRNHPKSQRTL